MAKEESRFGMSVALRGLGRAYSQLDLLWASNNCYVTACAISFKSWFEQGVVDRRTFQCVHELLKNELFIGRIPSFLLWHELYKVLKTHLNETQEKTDVPDDIMNDACLSIRILHSPVTQKFSYLPSVFGKAGLTISQDASYYSLGYIDILLNEENGIGAFSELELNVRFEKIASQPFVEQMLYKTNLVDESTVSFTSKILGCEFVLQLEADKELILAAETILAFLEAFLATSLTGIFPTSEKIIIQIVHDPAEKLLTFIPEVSSNKYQLKLDKFDFAPEILYSVGKKLNEFIGHMLARNFMFKDLEGHFDNLFAKEEVLERLTLIWAHRKLTINVNGNNPKITLNDWISPDEISFPNKRSKPISFFIDNGHETKNTSLHSDPDQASHSQRTVNSVIDIQVWQNAKWQAFGGAIFQDHLGVFLGFDNGEEALQIFEDWINRFGKVDKDEMIRIALIKGISKDHPYWYRIHVTGKQLGKKYKADNIIYSISQVHEMLPNSPKNLDLIINNYNRFNKFILYPAKVSGENKIEPYYKRGILKNELLIKWAWEIGENDIDSAAIKDRDKPFIPSNVSDAPVLRLLQRKKNGIE